MAIFVNYCPILVIRYSNCKNSNVYNIIIFIDSLAT